jgi:hypothetical protein
VAMIQPAGIVAAISQSTTDCIALARATSDA